MQWSPAKPSVPNAVRRTFKPFSTAPRDGTAFAMTALYRFNVERDCFQKLWRIKRDCGFAWQDAEWPCDAPEWWFMPPPLSWSVPLTAPTAHSVKIMGTFTEPATDWQPVTLQYRCLVKRQSVRQRLASVMVAVWRRLLAGSVRSTTSAVRDSADAQDQSHEPQ
jgi:hypothetical protein